MARIDNNIILQGISGQIGKQLLIKHYAHGDVLSAYPDMSGIKTSKKQEEKREKFKEAVAYAQAIVRDPKKKQAYLKKVNPGQSVYHFALKEYLLAAK